MLTILSDTNTADGAKDLYAAVDLGSNSFHLLISVYRNGEFTVIDRQREVVRLAAGLDERNRLSQEVADRALACLSRFGQLLRSIPAQNIRAVGTNALRRLHGKGRFLDKAEAALGRNIEIIAGREEARLIYLGVSKWSSGGSESRLVIDIGGGSTEIISGRGEKSYLRESLEVGCVVLSKQFFDDGKLSKKRFRKAILAAELAIQPVVEQFRKQGWNEVIGCSGTMKSIAQTMIQSDLSKDGIHRDGLQRLLEKTIKAKHIDNLELPGLTKDRMAVFAGGLSIILALFELFELKEMSVSDIALREGVLFDLVGRSSPEDIRDTTVSSMQMRWAVDLERSQAVRSTALTLFGQVREDWDIRDPLYQKALGWAAQLHEIGLRISHDGYHRHGAYIIANGDMAGFARRDQLLLAALITGHRRKFPIEAFEALPSVMVTPAKRVAVILRLAVLLHRARHCKPDHQASLSAKGQQLALRCAAGWLDENALTEADLAQERAWLKGIGLKLDYL